MKTTILTSSFIALSVTLLAQNIQIKDTSGTLMNGQTYYKAGLSTATVIQVDDIDVYNTTGAAMSVKLKRYEMTVQPGTGNSYCWSICTSEAPAGTYPMWNSGPPQNINASASFTSFTADHYPHNIAGTNVYRFVFYDYSNPNDSAYFDVQFDVTVGVNEWEASDYVVNVYPNPAASFIYFQVNGNNHNDVKIVFTDALGKSVKIMEVPSASETLKLNVGAFNPGLYFYTLTVNEVAISTKRILITR